MSQLLPVIVRVGQGGAEDALERLSDADREAHYRAVAGWMPAHSVLARGSASPAAIQLGPATVLGRTGSGGVAALSSGDLSALLGLPGLLAGKANLIHGHDFRNAVTGIDWTTLQDGRILARIGGAFVWIPIPTGGGGGGGGITSPLTAELDIGLQAIVSGEEELIRFSGGGLTICGRPFPKFSPDDPDEGSVWIYRGGEWEPGVLSGAGLLPGTPGLGSSIAEALATLQGRIAGRAPASHGHGLSDIRGETPGAWVRIGPGGTLEEVDPPTGGGVGPQSPLRFPLDIADQPIVSGDSELLRFGGGSIFIGGQQLFPAAIVSPTRGHSVIYDETASAFVNRRLREGDVDIAVPGISGDTLGEGLDELLTAIEGRSLIGHVHNLSQIVGDTPGRFVAVGSDGRLEEVPAPSGGPGGGGLQTPLTVPLDIADQPIVSGGRELIRVVEGEIELDGQQLFPSAIVNPTEGQPAVYDAATGSFRNKRVPAAQVLFDRAGSPIDAQALLEAILGLFANHALVEHTHNVDEIEGDTPGRFIAVGSDGRLEEVPAPTGGPGGGLQSPLTSALDIASQAIVSGDEELIRFEAGAIYVGGQELFPSAIVNPSEGDPAVYDADSGAFQNKPLPAPKVLVDRGGVSVDLQTYLNDLAAQVAANSGGGSALEPTVLNGGTPETTFQQSLDGGQPDSDQTGTGPDSSAKPFGATYDAGAPGDS